MVKGGIKRAQLFKEQAPCQERRSRMAWFRLHKTRVPELRLFVAQFRNPEVLNVRSANVEFGAGLKAGELPGQFFSMPNVVGIKEGNELSLCCAQAQIACAGGPGIGLPYVPDQLAIVRQHLGCRIGRAIIGNDDL